MTVRVGDDDFIAADEFAFVGFIAGNNAPAAQDERDRPIGSDPFSVIFSCKMKVGAGGYSAFTGRVADVIVCLQPRAGFHAVLWTDVHIKEIPSGLFIPVSVQINHDRAMFRADYKPGRGCCYPGRGSFATGFGRGWCEINCGVYAVRNPINIRADLPPAVMRAAG